MFFQWKAPILFLVSAPLEALQLRSSELISLEFTVFNKFEVVYAFC
jgi:hypothetical protein